ncbi:MAG TPA: hypothetical protein VFC00_19855 [Micromonosporaceae bacterium]|nr:hypothetical protein [Micromonosporaceae bacterium]
MFRRRKVTPYRPLFRSELAQVLAHLQLAGLHAAAGAASTAGAGAARLRGRWQASLGALAPVLDAARLEAQRANMAAAKTKAKSKAKANKKKGKAMSSKWPYIVGAIAAGAAVGAGAYAIRKRRNARRAAESALTGDARDLVARSALGTAANDTAGEPVVTGTSAPAKETWVKTKDTASRDGKAGKVLEPTGL